MEPIRNFDQLTAHLKTLNRRKRIAVVCANDPNTEYAIARALDEEIAEFLMIGDSAILQKYPSLQKYPEYVKTCVTAIWCCEASSITASPMIQHPI